MQKPHKSARHALVGPLFVTVLAMSAVAVVMVGAPYAAWTLRKGTAGHQQEKSGYDNLFHNVPLASQMLSAR